METLNVKLTSNGPMLMHSDLLADPLHPATKKLKAMTDDRTFKSTDEGKLAIAKHKYLNSFYFDSDGQIAIPTLNIRKSLIQGARLSKGGKEIERGVIFTDIHAPLIFEGPSDPEKLWDDSNFVDVRSVVVGRQRIPAYRPVFKEWSSEVSIIVDPEIINKANLQRYWQAAGAFMGIGDFRPLFGRYEAEIV